MSGGPNFLQSMGSQRVARGKRGGRRDVRVEDIFLGGQHDIALLLSPLGGHMGSEGGGGEEGRKEGREVVVT